MPLKYLADMPYPNKVFGMLHGLLTVLYLFALIEFAMEHKIGFKKSILFLLASLLPFGTFYADKKWLKPMAA
jgi:integral membrane protein